MDSLPVLNPWDIKLLVWSKVQHLMMIDSDYDLCVAKYVSG